MRSSHTLDRLDVAFDDDRLVADAGLLLPATLAHHLGLRELVETHLDLGRAAGPANVGDKLLSLVMSALAGGDTIDDADALRAGGTGRVLGFAVKAASTLGTFLRSFRWGHVRQLDRVSRELLARAFSAGAGPGATPFTIDLDSTICETYGLAKEGATHHGYTGVRGYHPLLAVAAGTGDSLATRYEALEAELERLNAALARLVGEAAPELVARFGVGPDSAGALLVAAGDNPGRLRSEAAFAMLCGASPIEASSGKIARHRLNRGGDRQADAALYHVVMSRLRCDVVVPDSMRLRRLVERHEVIARMFPVDAVAIRRWLRRRPGRWQVCGSSQLLAPRLNEIRRTAVAARSPRRRAWIEHPNWLGTPETLRIDHIESSGG